MIEFCCKDMKLKAQANKNDPYAMKCIEFDLSTRAFSIYVHMDPKLSICIAYCPFCGAKLPKELIDEKYNIICDELGLDYVSSSNEHLPKKKLPKEFETDEWWRKRGL